MYMYAICIHFWYKYSADLKTPVPSIHYVSYFADILVKILQELYHDTRQRNSLLCELSSFQSCFIVCKHVYLRKSVVCVRRKSLED